MRRQIQPPDLQAGRHADVERGDGRRRPVGQAIGAADLDAALCGKMSTSARTATMRGCGTSRYRRYFFSYSACRRSASSDGTYAFRTFVL